MTSSYLPTEPAVVPDLFLAARRKQRRRLLAFSVAGFLFSLTMGAFAALLGRYGAAATAEGLTDVQVLRGWWIDADMVRSIAYAIAVGFGIGFVTNDVRNLFRNLGWWRTGRALTVGCLAVSYLLVAVAVLVLAKWTQPVAAFLHTRPIVVTAIAGAYALAYLAGSVFEWRILTRYRVQAAWDQTFQDDVEAEIAERQQEINSILRRAGIEATGVDGVRELADRAVGARRDYEDLWEEARSSGNLAADLDGASVT